MRQTIAVVGAYGFVGAELNRILSAHPKVAGIVNFAEIQEMCEMTELLPNLPAGVRVLPPAAPAEVAAAADIIFTALPAGKSVAFAEAALAQGKKVVDLGADYRFDSWAAYTSVYGGQEDSPTLAQAVYGLPEINRERIGQASLVGNPGCYPTSVILALTPLLEVGLVDLQRPLLVDAKSGVTGAGAKLERPYLYTECNESIRPYNPFVHRHQPEIAQELSKAAGSQVDLLFVPHLLPVNRGILADCYIHLQEKMALADIVDLLTQRYCRESFIKVLPLGKLPDIKWVRGSNTCMLGAALDAATGTLLVTSAIDNRVKGAAGQAVQNMNIMAGWPEEYGLSPTGMYL